MNALLKKMRLAACLMLVCGVAQAADLPTFKLLIKDGRLFPETLEVPANTRFRLEITNAGPGAAEFESLELRKESVLAPGVTRTLVFHPLKPGRYPFFD
ncbi:MAG: cupredoxin domain-containing protein, partial [Zoogloeaceae bacterium]|nr:cupredoxin domain-containing protein [Zoogloeaceae bacterium]